MHEIRKCATLGACRLSTPIRESPSTATQPTAGRLDGAQRYRLRFPANDLPPLAELGFWSLTIYGQNARLVANPIDRYVFRPDDGLRFDDDGGLILAIQATTPDDVAQENWLPAPDGPFDVALRLYLPLDQILDGIWFPPGLVRV